LNKHKPKVLIVQEVIPDYRIPVFNRLAEKFDLTITTKEEWKKSEQFNVVTINFYGNKLFHFPITSNIFLKQFDVIIYSFNIRYLPLLYLLLIRRSLKIILWGIGVTSENGFDVHNKFDKIRYFYANLARSVVFYSEYSRKKYIKEGHINPQKLFVAHNTLSLSSELYTDDKEYFVFVGSFKKYKRVDRFIELLNQAYIINPTLSKILMIGDGEYFAEAKQHIYNFELSDKIQLLGAINDEMALQEIYRKSIASISPYQAGLSVLQSMAKGVPFVTLYDSITGGERYNIIHLENGILAESEEDLVKHLIRLDNEKEFQLKLSHNAYNYFKNKCSIDNMAAGFEGAIKYTLNG